MAVLDLFSKRQKRAKGEVVDVFQYESIPDKLRVQVVHILAGALGSGNELRIDKVNKTYKVIVDSLCREYGVFVLPPTQYRNLKNWFEELFDFFMATKSTDEVLDVIELCFRMVDAVTRDYYYLSRHNADEVATRAIDELNVRFRENGVGYQFESGELIRVDSQVAHAEIVKPALQLLSQKSFSGPQQEFLAAYDHYRHGKNKEALNDCLKAFESTMKAICDKRSWEYERTDTAAKLIQVCLDNGLVPSFWQTQFAALRTLLESSVPTGRNKLSGHGQGTSPVEVPNHIAAYMLHMTASAIVFLATAEAELA